MTGEYIYGGWWGGELSKSLMYRFRVVKRTAKRIHYQRPGERIDQHGKPYAEAQFGSRDSELPRKEGSIDKWEFTIRGRVFNSSRGDGEKRMYANLADLIARGKPRPGDELEQAEEWISRGWRPDKSVAHEARAKILQGLMRRRPLLPDLAALKATMVAAHPDKGGSSAAFIKARATYVAARRVLRRKVTARG